MSWTQRLTSTPEPDPRNKKKFYFADTSQRQVLIILARAFFKMVMKYDVRRLKNLPHAEVAILAANYVANLDVFPIQFAIPRVVCFMGNGIMP
jgi:1-acyl-sn-glycerol-3-phosphate acyltransferase